MAKAWGGEMPRRITAGGPAVVLHNVLISDVAQAEGYHEFTRAQE